MNDLTFHLTPLEIGLMVVEGCTLALFFYARFIKRGSLRDPERMASSTALDPFKDFVKECQTICQNLAQNLEEKNRLTNQFLEKLDEKIQGAAARSPVAAKGKDVQEQILALVESGQGIPDISRSLNLPPGEVQLIWDLNKFSR